MFAHHGYFNSEGRDSWSRPGFKTKGTSLHFRCLVNLRRPFAKVCREYFFFQWLSQACSWTLIGLSVALAMLTCGGFVLAVGQASFQVLWISYLTLKIHWERYWIFNNDGFYFLLCHFHSSLQDKVVKVLRKLLPSYLLCFHFLLPDTEFFARARA